MAELSGDDWAMLRAVSRHVMAGQIDDFHAQGRACGWCSRPVRLRGRVAVTDVTTGRRTVALSSDDRPDGVVLKACGNRRRTVCPACAGVYGADARHLVRAGLLGGKGVDTAVAGHPAVLLTLTAPSFGPVHRATDGGVCRQAGPARCRHARPLGCSLVHAPADHLVGAPLCPDCYDHEAAVLHNAATPELWRRTTIYVTRHLARVLGLTQAQLRAVARVSFCRVAELQRRGSVHLHAVVRADGMPPGTVPPVDARQLALACLTAARAVSVTHPRGVARWGPQVDAEPIDRDPERTGRVAAYIAKYATKSSDAAGELDRRIRSEDDLAARRLPDHLRALVVTAWALGADDDLRELELRRHAHTLGYGGHFLSKSLRYSTTFGALRQARAQWRADRSPLQVDAATHTVDARWEAVGIGWAGEGERLYAAARRATLEDERRAARDALSGDWSPADDPHPVP